MYVPTHLLTCIYFWRGWSLRGTRGRGLPAIAVGGHPAISHKTHTHGAGRGGEEIRVFRVGEAMNESYMGRYFLTKKPRRSEPRDLQIFLAGPLLPASSARQTLRSHPWGDGSCTRLGGKCPTRLIGRGILSIGVCVVVGPFLGQSFRRPFASISKNAKGA